MNRFGLVGDVHAEDQLLEAALDFLARERVDGILCVGDIADGRGDVDRCVELLEAHHVAAVRGNHDRWCVADQLRDLREATVLDALTDQTRWYLAHLPTTLRIETVAGPLLLSHAFGEDDMVFVGEVLDNAPDDAMRRYERGRLLRLIPSDVALVVAGHSHRRGVRQVGRVRLIDAGTLRSGDDPCVGVLNLEQKVVQWYDLNEDGSKVLVSERLALDEESRTHR